MARLKLLPLSRKTLLSFAGLSSSLLLLFAIGLGIYINKTKAETVSTPNAFSTPAILGEQFNNEPPTALITKETGDVEYKLPNEAEYKRLENQEERVPTGTSVKTGKKSLAHVVFPDNSLMSMSQNTEVVLNFEDKKIKIFQILGNTWNRVEKVLEGHSYAVETPNTLATVRGTEFNVAVLANKRSEISVTESIVDVSKIEKKSDGQVEVKETQRVEENKQVVVTETKSKSPPPLKVETIPEEKKQTIWFQRNIELTEEIKKAEEEIKVSIAPEAGTIAPAISQPPLTISDEIKSVAIEKVMDSIKENAELEKIDTNDVLEKNEEKMMKEFSETVMTSEETSQGEVQGVTAAPVVIEENNENLDQAEIGGRGADHTPTEEPTIEPTQPEVASPTEEPQPTQDHPSPTQQESQTEETSQQQEESQPWYQGPMEAIQHIFSSDPQPTTPMLE